MIQMSNEALIPIERIDGPRGGVNWALTYAMLVRYQFTNRITKLPTQAMRDKTK